MKRPLLNFPTGHPIHKMRSGIGGDYAVAVTFNTMKQDGKKLSLA